jgi:hypothetical protein
VSLKTSLMQSLSLDVRQELRERWNNRVRDEFAFTPFELRGKVSIEEATHENVELGKFSSSYLKQILLSSTREDRLRRLSKKSKIVAVGYGRGYDNYWLKEAVGHACLETWWIDVSDVACEWAKADLDHQFESLKPSDTFRYPDYEVKRQEIQTTLEDPGSIGLDLDTVEIWYLCRVLGCLSKESVRVVLLGLGATLSKEHDPGKEKKIVLVLAFKNDNQNRVGSTSAMYSRGMVLGNIAEGAERSIRVSYEAKYRYFSQIYTAITVSAK